MIMMYFIRNFLTKGIIIIIIIIIIITKDTKYK